MKKYQIMPATSIRLGHLSMDIYITETQIKYHFKSQVYSYHIHSPLIITMAFLSIVVFLGVICCSTTSASFTSTATKFAKATMVPNTLLGAYSRSSTVASLSLLEQEKLAEAKESLAQSALTLALLDVGGGAVLPVAEEITNYVKTHRDFAGTREAWRTYNGLVSDEAAKAGSEVFDKQAIRGAKQALKKALKADVSKFSRTSKVGKAFAKASKWLKGASVFDVLGPITDTLSIGLNIWGLEMAIRDNNPAGIAAASLSIAAGVVGLTTFFAAIITGSTILGPIGAIAGALIGIAATLIELFGGPGYDVEAVEAHRDRLRQLRRLRDACSAQIVTRMDFLEKTGTLFTDVYANNQASLLYSVRSGQLKMYDCYHRRRGLYRNPGCDELQYDSSLHLRKYVGPKLSPHNSVDTAEEELRNVSNVCMGKYRGIVSPYMPLEESSTGWGKTIDFIGFDFYGRFKSGTSYGGAFVFINTGFVSGEILNGIDIDTYIPNDDVEQNDVISIDEYRNFRLDQEIKIQTGSGTDCLNINGMIGEFNSRYVDKLKVVLGGGLFNVLSFQGISKDRKDIKGVFFDSKEGILKYYHGQNRNTHQLGTVENVWLFKGSPFDDHVILYTTHHIDNPTFRVIQTSGRNVYEFNFDDLIDSNFYSRKFQIVDESDHPPKIIMRTAHANKLDRKYMILEYKRLTVYDKSTGRPVLEIELDTKNTGNVFINDADPIPLDHAHISPWPHRLNANIKSLSFPPFPSNLHFGDGNELLLLKWRTDHDQNSADLVIDMKAGENFLIISDKYFLDPCGVDGETVTLTLKAGSVTGAYTISIENTDDANFSFNIELRNMYKIINEYGNQLVYMRSHEDYSPPVPMDLYDKYMEVTRETLDIKTTENVLEED